MQDRCVPLGAFGSILESLLWSVLENLHRAVLGSGLRAYLGAYVK